MGLHIDRPFSIIYNRQGIEQGIEQGIKQVVINMFHQNVSLDDISKFTKLDIEKIKEIIKNNKD